MRAVNLLPQDARGGTGLASFKPRPAHALAAVLFLLAVFALLYGQARKQTQTAENEVATVRAETAAVERASAKDAAAAAAIPAFEKYVSGVANVVTSRYGWAPLFHQLAVTVPSGVEFTNLTMTLGEAGAGAASTASASTSALGSPQAATMDLKGCSYTQPQVATLMRHLRAVDNVSEMLLVSSVKNSQQSSGSGSGSGASSGATAGAAVRRAEPPSSCRSPSPHRTSGRASRLRGSCRLARLRPR